MAKRRKVVPKSIVKFPRRSKKGWAKLQAQLLSLREVATPALKGIVEALKLPPAPQWIPNPDQRVWDLVTILSRHRSEEDRMKAASRLAKSLGNVIYKARRKSVQPELRRLAEMHRRTKKQELEKIVVARLFESAEAGGQYTPAEIEEAVKVIRQQLNDLVTTDLLGPVWRLRTAGGSRLKEIEFEEKQTLEDSFKLNLFAQVEARLSLERLIAGANLTDREKDVFYLHARDGIQFDAIAAKLKIKTTNARVVYLRARKKIQKIL